jgi:hypothetical protein
MRIQIGDSGKATRPAIRFGVEGLTGEGQADDIQYITQRNAVHATSVINSRVRLLGCVGLRIEPRKFPFDGFQVDAVAAIHHDQVAVLVFHDFVSPNQITAYCFQVNVLWSLVNLAVRNLVVKLCARGNAFGFKLIERFYEVPIDAAFLLAPLRFPQTYRLVLDAAAHRRMTLKAGQLQGLEEKLL